MLILRALTLLKKRSKYSNNRAAQNENCWIFHLFSHFEPLLPAGCWAYVGSKPSNHCNESHTVLAPHSRAPGGVAGFVFVWDVVSNLPLSVGRGSVRYWWFSPTEQAWRIDILFSTAALSTLLFVPRVKANPIICSCSSTWLCTMKSSTFFLLVAEMTTYGTLPFGIDEARCLHIPYPNVALKGHGFGKGLCRENQNRAPTHAAGTHSWLQTDSLCPCNTTATATCEHSGHWAQIATRWASWEQGHVRASRGNSKATAVGTELWGEKSEGLAVPQPQSLSLQHTGRVQPNSSPPIFTTQAFQVKQQSLQLITVWISPVLPYLLLSFQLNLSNGIGLRFPFWSKGMHLNEPRRCEAVARALPNTLPAPRSALCGSAAGRTSGRQQ